MTVRSEAGERMPTQARDVRVGWSDTLRIAAARRSWTLYKYQNTVVTMRFGSRRIRIPIFDRIGLYNVALDDRDLRFAALLRRLLSGRAGTVIDVGANIGQFMLRLLVADPQRAWIGFDPLISCCNYVEHVIRENRLTRHTILPLGLADRPGIVSLYYSDDTDVSASAVDGFYSDQHARLHRPIVVERGDDVLRRLDADAAVALLKIDTEGGEHEVLEGFDATIARCRPLLIVEVAPYAHVANPAVRALREERIRRLDALLKGLGYALHRIRNGDGLEAVGDRLDPGSSTDLVDMDYLGVPSESALP